MSSGKESARDLRWGRQGGRWAPSNPGDPRSIEEIKADTIAAGGTWPGEDPPTESECDESAEPSLFDTDDEQQ